MILGKVKVKVESVGSKYLFCRPLIAGNDREFPARYGICHVIYVERGLLTEHVNTQGEYWFYGIFDKAPASYHFDGGYMNTKVSPITEEIYNALIEIYPQRETCFSIN
jgi:hypothetical protein